jgi:hypothetical protein
MEISRLIVAWGRRDLFGEIEIFSNRIVIMVTQL